MELAHERQVRLLCAQHAINPILARAGKEKTNESELDEAAKVADAEEAELLGSKPWQTWITPNRWAGLGNFSIGVLQKVAARRELVLKHLRSDEISQALLEMKLPESSTFGLMCNRKAKILRVIPTRHWFSVVVGEDGLFYNMDSKLDEPVSFESQEAVELALKKENISVLAVQVLGE